MKYWICIAAVGTVFWSGCQEIIYPEARRTDHFYVNPQANFATVGRVALLELDNQTTRPELSEIFTQALADGLGKRNLFSIQKVMQTDSVWQTHRLGNMQSHTLDDLAAARQAMGVDAVMFGTIQRYMPFPHLQIGVNLRMIDTRSGRLLWAVEDVWDSSDKAVERRMKRYFNEHIRTGYEPMNWQILVTSPRAFDRYVAYEIAETLPELARNVVPQTIEYRRRYRLQ